MFYLGCRFIPLHFSTLVYMLDFFPHTNISSSKGNQQCIVIISCDAGRDIPDINFEDASSSGDEGGGDDEGDGIPQFLSLYQDFKPPPTKGDDGLPPKLKLYNFRLRRDDHHLAEWHALLVGDCLHVEVPNGAMPNGSKECFVSLLEYAEETLDCKYVFVCLEKDRPDRVNMMRTFMFMGFETVMPSHKLCPSSPGHVFMAYTIE